MKKILVLLAVLTAVWCVSCSNEDDNDPSKEEEKGGEGVITMVVKDYVYGLKVYSFKEGEMITIDWGDETVEEFKTVLQYNEYNEEDDETRYWTHRLDHKYSNSNPHIITIKGNIKRIDCDENHFISLDVSKCTALKELECYGNDLTSLDVSKNTALTYLSCSWNNLISLNVSGCTALKELTCHRNNLTSLNASGCPALETLECSYNELTSLNVSGCTALKELDCSDNELTAEALNKIFTDLPQTNNSAYIYIGGNPGTETCDESIAEKKGWEL